MFTDRKLNTAARSDALVEKPVLDSSLAEAHKVDLTVRSSES